MDYSWHTFWQEVRRGVYYHGRGNGQDVDDEDYRAPRIRAVARAINAQYQRPLDEMLQSLYDPDLAARQFMKPMDEWRHLPWVPVATPEGDTQPFDPVVPHRLQVLSMGRNAKGVWEPQLTEHHISTAQELRDLSQTTTYRRAKLYESTGEWATGAFDEARYRKFREATDPYLFGEPDDVGFGGSTSVTRDIDQEFVPLIGGPHSRQLYLYAHWEQTAKAFYEKNHSELARTAIVITTDFTLGRGIHWKITNRRVERVWSEFWERNHMEQRLRTWCDDLCLDGDTRIACLDGTNPTIAELAERNASDDNPIWVYSYDHNSGRVVPGKAVRCWRQPRQKRCVAVALDNGEEIIASHDHPFLMRDGRYVWAEELSAGDSLMPLYRKLKNGRYEQVWHPDIQGQHWQVTHHAVLTLHDEAFTGLGLSVHHHNDNPRDNQPGNLTVKPTTAHIGDHARSRWLDPEGRARMEDGFRYARNTKSGRQRQRNNAACLWANPDAKAQAIQGIRTAYATPEVQKRHADGIRRSWTDPEVRRRRSVGIAARARERFANPEARARLSVAQRLRWASPERRAQHSQQLKAAHATRKTRTPNNHTVVSVRSVDERWVYDMSVETYHNFALDAGVFVSNTWQGELLIRKDEPLAGHLRVRSLDPSVILEIVTEPEDVEAVLFYHHQAPTAWQQPFSNLRNPALQIPTMRYIITQYPAREVHHVKLNVSSSEKWGRSDFYSSFATLKRHRDWVNAVTLKDMLHANLVWKIRLTGDDQDVDSFVADSNNTQLPPPGGTWVENTALELSPIHADMASSARTGQGNVGDFLLSLFAAAQQMPVTYFNGASGGPARATALQQGEPFVKKVMTRQQVLINILDHLFEEVVIRAYRAGILEQNDLRGVNPDWIFPSIYEEDRGAKFRDLDFLYQREVVSHRTLATMGAQEIGLSDYHYRNEQLAIAAEKQAHGGTAIGLPAPPEPGMPGEMGGEGGSGLDGALAALLKDTKGRNERLAGTDERNRFRRQQREKLGPGSAET